MHEDYSIESTELYKGVFWIVNIDDVYSNKKYCFVIPCNSEGISTLDHNMALNAKSGTTYNHEKLWSSLSSELTHNKPFDYYPRGRVQIAHGKATVYLNPNINTEEVQSFIKDEFNLTSHNGINRVVFNSDGSQHYKCYLDN